jgi:3-methylfumaryl-CoA hydratase
MATSYLVFVIVRHEISDEDGLLLSEEHDIVYRDHPSEKDNLVTSKKASTISAWCRQITANEVMLFRYSALTFNGHRIHYDRRYVTEVEKYPGLVVH